MGAVILRGVQHLSCPNCSQTAVKGSVAAPGVGLAEMHHCAGLRGLLAPLVVDGVACKVEAVDRGDYVGRERVQRDGEGRPVMAVVTTRDDGNDCMVLAPTAHAVRGR